MITICEIDSTDAVRALSEHRSPKRFLHSVPLRDFRAPKAEPNVINSGWKVPDRLADSKSTMDFGIRRGWVKRETANGAAAADPYPWKRPPQAPQKLTVRFRELLEDFALARMEPFTANDFDAWLMDHNVNYSHTTLNFYLRLADKDGLVTGAGERGNYHEKLYLYAKPNS